MLLAKIFKHFKARDAEIAPPNKHTGDAVSIWRDTGQVYYLENTLKLTYQSNSGAITIEKVSLESLPRVLKELQNLDVNSPLARQEVANQTDAFYVSVCGVTWQRSSDGNNVRIKALPEAAVLRSPTACFTKSQAVFKHAFMLEHDDLLSPTSSSSKPGIYTYNRISIADFTEQLKRSNAQIAPSHKAKVGIQYENFKSAFTEHEQAIIDQCLETEFVEKVDDDDGKMNLLSNDDKRT
ncbi:hypothetical protein BM527_12200 [Alteromonas sp. Mex14]|nr:hypothetical protein BM527_12200 [Alteromonas sp. Mex14]